MDEEHYLTCDVAKAFRAWHDTIAVQEEHSLLSGALEFAETQSRLGWIDHQECILPVIELTADEIMESKTPAEAYVMVKSGLCQIALICFVLGRQHEGAEV